MPEIWKRYQIEIIFHFINLSLYAFLNFFLWGHLVITNVRRVFQISMVPSRVCLKSCLDFSSTICTDKKLGHVDLLLCTKNPFRLFQLKFHIRDSHEWKNISYNVGNMRRAEIRCSQSDTSLYQSVFAEHVTKIRVRFFWSKHTGSDTIIDDYVLQMWETF